MGKLVALKRPASAQTKVTPGAKRDHDDHHLLSPVDKISKSGVNSRLKKRSSCGFLSEESRKEMTHDDRSKYKPLGVSAQVIRVLSSKMLPG